MHTARRAWTTVQFQIMIEPSVWFTQADYWENKDSEAGNYGLSGQAGAQKLAEAIIDSIQSAPVQS